ncbi:hypothetical protein Pan97_38400 [Bremerella volcania]|uniref:Uncharacterized protein n=1 Tax=Bremerella volcania TaxID=2527984 RepID=A0A518CC33_9BACT|nr:hypothetical protein [Bremerella volcania]QDU76783.1 hypothetical protein Pan97_38400 [Bremerella volcania]
MSSIHQQPEPGGKRKPQVVVRAEKYFVCSSCGVMVEIPEDVVGQLVIAVDPAPQEKTVEQSVACEETTPAATIPLAPPRPKRPKQPKRTHLTGEIIDGLRVPRSAELDRALAWVTFHLKVLDRQGSELKRLKKLLENESTARGPCLRPHGYAKKFADIELQNSLGHPCEDHAHSNVSMVPERRLQNASQTQERGPP